MNSKISDMVTISVFIRWVFSNSLRYGRGDLPNLEVLVLIGTRALFCLLVLMGFMFFGNHLLNFGFLNAFIANFKQRASLLSFNGEMLKCCRASP